MKLTVRHNAATRDVNIRNPAATVANLRAAIAITLKLEAHAFRMQAGEKDLDDDRAPLSSLGLADGDVVTLAAKRPRDDGTTAPAPTAVATGATAAPQSPLTAPARPPPRTETSTASPPPSSAAGGNGGASPNVARAPVAASQTPPAPTTTTTTTTTTAASGPVDPARLQQLVDMGFEAGVSRMALARHNNDADRATAAILSGDFARTGSAGEVGTAAAVSPGRAAPAYSLAAARRSRARGAVAPVEGSTSSDEGEDEEEGEEDEEWADDDGEEGEEGEETEEEAEQAELVSALLELPNARQLRDEFLADPQAVMAGIMQRNPRLFELIARHNQFFLDLVTNADALLDAGDGLEGDGEEGEEGEEYEEWEEEEDGMEGLEGASASSSDVEGAPAPLPRPTRRAGRGGALMSGGGAASTSGAGAGGAPPTPVPTEADNVKIAGLMELGFSREQCTAAYFRNGRNVERAAGWLFDNQPSGV